MSEHGYRLRIVTGLGERCTAVPLQVQGSVRTWLKVSLQVQGSDKTK